MEIVNGLTAVLGEMWAIVMNVFGSADTVSLAIMLLVVVAFGLRLGELGRLVQVTVWSLVVAGLLRLAYSVVGGADPMTLPTTAWSNLKVMSVGDLTVYFLAFAILITVVHTIRGAVGSRGH